MRLSALKVFLNSLSDWHYLTVLSVVYSVLSSYFWKHSVTTTFIDTGRELYIPFEMAVNKAVLYKDILNIYGPLSYQINSALLQIFGLRVEVLLLAGFLGGLAVIFSLYLIGRLFLEKTFCFMVVVSITLSLITCYGIYMFPYSYAMVYALVFFLAGFALFLYGQKKGSRQYFYTSFLLFGASLACKPDFFVSIFIILLVHLFSKKYSLVQSALSITATGAVPLLSFLSLVSQGLTLSALSYNLSFVSHMAATDSIKFLYRNGGVIFGLWEYANSLYDILVFTYVLAIFIIFSWSITFLKIIFESPPEYVYLPFAGKLKNPFYNRFKQGENETGVSASYNIPSTHSFGTSTIQGFILTFFSLWSISVFLPSKVWAYLNIILGFMQFFLQVIVLILIVLYVLVPSTVRQLNRATPGLLLLIAVAVSSMTKGMFILKGSIYIHFLYPLVVLVFFIVCEHFISLLSSPKHSASIPDVIGRLFSTRRRLPEYFLGINPARYVLLLVVFLGCYLCASAIYSYSLINNEILTPYGSLKANSDVSAALTKLSDYLTSESSPGDTVLAIPEGIITNLMADRKTDNHLFTMFVPPFLEAYGEDNIIEELKVRKIKYIVIARRSMCEYINVDCSKEFFGEYYGEKVFDYIKSEYTHIKTISIRNPEIPYAYIYRLK